MFCWANWSFLLGLFVWKVTDSLNFPKKDFLTVLHRKLALSVSFCVRKVDFPALVRENLNCAENQNELKILAH